jgi:manganese transport protein
VVLSFQLPFAIWPLIRLTSDSRVMGRYANGLPTRAVAWSLFVLICVANVWLVGRLLGAP